MQLTAPSQIAGDGTATLGYSLDDTSTQAATGVVTIQVTTTQGAVLDILLDVTVVPLTPVLAANPGYLDSGMVVGAQTLVSFTVVNNGGAPSGDLQVSLPSTSYMSLASPATIPSLAPGASSTVTVELTPPSNLPLEEYTGTIGVSGAQTGISVPFTFTAITTATGTVHVLVDDDYTFEEAGSPHVQGATVNLLNPYDNTDIVATGVTDATGAVTFTNVPAGPYDLQVKATGPLELRKLVHRRRRASRTTTRSSSPSQFVTLYLERGADDDPGHLPDPAPDHLPDGRAGARGHHHRALVHPDAGTRPIVDLQRHDHQPRPDRGAGRDPDLPTDPEYTFTALSTDIGVVPAESSVDRSHHGDAGGSPVAVHQRRRHDVHHESGGAQPGRPGHRVHGLRGLYQYRHRGHPGAALGADGDAGQQPGGLPVSRFLAGRPGLRLERHARRLQPDRAVPGQRRHPRHARARRERDRPRLLRGLAVIRSGTRPLRSPSASARWIRPTRDDHRLDFRVARSSARFHQQGRLERDHPDPGGNLGSTWGQYVQTLDNDAAYLAGIGEPTTDLNQLLSFEIEKANAAYTAQTLVTVTADDLPAPGMDLTFVQSFQQSISGRYTQGILGYGWTTNWDISATTMTNGDVVIDDDGISEYFSLQPNGSFAPEAGDEGTTLTVSGGAYQLVEPDGTIYQFNTNGTLNYVQDTHGNRITAGYNAQGQLVSLTDSNGEYLDLAYNAQGHLATLTDSNGQTETYGYDPTGQFLTSYTDVYGTTTYTYVTGQSAAQNNALAEITYADRHRRFLQLRFRGPAHRPARERRRRRRDHHLPQPRRLRHDRRRRQPDHRLLQPLRRHRRDHRPARQRHPLLLRQQPEPDRGRSARAVRPTPTPTTPTATSPARPTPSA